MALSTASSVLKRYQDTGHYLGMEVIPSAGLVAAPLLITHALIFNTNWEQMSQGEYLLLVASPQKEHCPAK